MSDGKRSDEHTHADGTTHSHPHAHEGHEHGGEEHSHPHTHEDGTTHTHPHRHDEEHDHQH